LNLGKKPTVWNSIDMNLGRIRIIVIGSSAGSSLPLKRIASDLPLDLAAAVFVVSHVSPVFAQSFLPNLLSGCGPLPAVYASDCEPIEAGRIYVAPPDFHMLIERHQIRLERSPKDPWNRPSINVAFRSAAAAYGSCVAGVVLSGMLYDGTAGLWAIKNAGGVAIVQAPYDADQPSMPQSAIDNVAVDHAIPAAEIGRLLTKLAGKSNPLHASLARDRPRILIVEDEAAQAIDLADQVRSLGYEVAGTVPSGEEALIAARDLPDVVLMDIRSAGKLDGIETSRILADNFRLSVVFTTAYDDVETIGRVASTPRGGYLNKPIRSGELRACIEAALQHRAYL
jgi:chemotaxis response regulator CheB